MLVPCGPIGPPAPVNSGVRPPTLVDIRVLMKSNECKLSIAAYLLVVTNSVSAGMYQCKDTDGRTAYRDTPCAGDQKAIGQEKVLPRTSSIEIKDLQEGLWEITSQKYIGTELSPHGTPLVRKQCIRKEWLKEQADINKQAAAVFGQCKEESMRVAGNTLDMAYQCVSRGTNIRIHYEFSFDGGAMRGAMESSGVIEGKSGREVHKILGRYLSPCH
jgi:hypothetical protein